MRLSSDTHFQYADAAPAVPVALLGNPWSMRTIGIVAFKGGPSHPYALARGSTP